MLEMIFLIILENCAEYKSYMKDIITSLSSSEDLLKRIENQITSQHKSIKMKM